MYTYTQTKREQENKRLSKWDKMLTISDLGKKAYRVFPMLFLFLQIFVSLKLFPSKKFKKIKDKRNTEPNSLGFA